MKRKNATRSALFTSIISLLLCVSMLVGTTFAWFTDSVASGVNTIAAGNLDVELYHGKNANPVDKVDLRTLLFTDVDGNVIDQWEPGVVAFTNLKVANVGTLALKYQLSVNSTEVNYVTTAEGAQLSLADALKVAVVDGGVNGGNRAGVIAAGETAGWQGLQSFTKSGVLEGNETSQTYGIVIYWQPSDNSHDNLFNMNNDKVTSDGNPLKITLGVNLFATQEMYEDDSFGDDYDEGLILPDVDGEVLVEDNGIQYYYNENGDYVLYLVTEAFTDTTLTIPEGVDAIGNYAFAYNSNVKEVVLPTTVRDLGRGFDSSSVKKVVLNEGLETISSRAFRSTPSLEEVVIPSTVTVIEDNAFQKSGIKNITIPATVKTIGETAFGSSQIETVTFEGNTSIQGYAFRGCSKLRTVNMNGDDVTFIASTLNNRNSTWFCNGESNNANTSKITFNVVNETVATRVKTAMGAEAGNTLVYINGKLFDPDATYTAEIDQLKAKLAAAQSGDTVEYALTHDAYIDSKITVPNGVTLVLNGNGHQAIVNTAYPFYVHNANIQMNDLTITGKATYAIFTKGAIWDYNGNNATVNASFNNVTVDLDKADNYPVVFNGIGEITMTDCTITGAGLSAEGNYRNGTHIFAGAEINLTVKGGTIGGVLMNANYADNSTLTISDGAVIDTLILATDQTKTATLTNNGGTVNKLIQQVDDATKLENALRGADANTVIDATGVTMTGTTGLDINGATIVGATFKSDNIAVRDTIHGTFKDCTFEGNETLRWCYSKAGETTIFENCKFKTDFRGVHFDALDGNVIFKNCEINGFNALGGSGTVTFENCTFGYDQSQYNGLNLYMNTNLKNCTFNYASGKTNFIDMEGTGKTLTITNCTATLDGAEANFVDFVGGSQLANNTVIYN